MKRHELGITTKTVIAYTNQENVMQRKVYATKVRCRTMTKKKANTNFAIIGDLRRIAELCNQKGISWKGLFDLLNQLPDKSEQGDLFESKKT